MGAVGTFEDVAQIESGAMVRVRFYFPQHPPKHTGHPEHWLPRPLFQYALAFADAANLPLLLRFLTLLFVWVRLPVPPACPKDLSPTNTGRGYPLVVFSHGLMGNHTAYSSFCSSLAGSLEDGRGCVVVAVEHTDGYNTFWHCRLLIPNCMNY